VVYAGFDESSGPAWVLALSLSASTVEEVVEEVEARWSMVEGELVRDVGGRGFDLENGKAKAGPLALWPEEREEEW